MSGNADTVVRNVQKSHGGKILHLYHNGVCLRLHLATASRPIPYFWS